MAQLALVVDDSMIIRHTVCRFLEQRGFAVESASNGAEAMLLAQQLRPSLIVTDRALLRRTPDGFRLDEVARGFTAAEVIALTGMTVSVAGELAVMQDAWCPLRGAQPHALHRHPGRAGLPAHQRAGTGGPPRRTPGHPTPGAAPRDPG